MKPLYLTLSILLLIFTNTFAQNHSHDEHLGELISSYLQMKDALVNDDFEGAQSHLSSFSDEVSMNEEMNHHPEHSEMHEAHHTSMLTAIQQASEAQNIDQLRASFDEITAELLKAVENQDFDKDKLYVQFCPMASNGNGAKWLSKSEEIRNPYYGSKMEKCGSTVETIN